MSGTQELERRLAAAEARLQRLEDVEAIRRLKARYGQLADSRYGAEGAVAEGELERIARETSLLFTEDAEWDGGAALGLCRGREAIYERFRRPTLRFSWHYFVKPQIEVEGDRAVGSWDILAACTSRKGEAQWMAGFEEDEYRRVEGTWLHSRMRLSVVFMAPYEQGWARSRR